MKIVDDADVRGAVTLQEFDDLDLVLRFAEPPAVIVESNLATQPRCSLGEWAQVGGFCLDALPLLRRIFRRRPSAHHP